MCTLSQAVRFLGAEVCDHSPFGEAAPGGVNPAFLGEGVLTLPQAAVPPSAVGRGLPRQTHPLLTSCGAVGRLLTTWGLSFLICQRG